MSRVVAAVILVGVGVLIGASLPAADVPTMGQAWDAVAGWVRG